MEIRDVIPKPETVEQWVFYPELGKPRTVEVWPAQGDTVMFVGELPYQTVIFKFPRLKHEKRVNAWKFLDYDIEEHERLYVDGRELSSQVIDQVFKERLMKRGYKVTQENAEEHPAS